MVEHSPKILAVEEKATTTITLSLFALAKPVVSKANNHLWWIERP